MEDLLNSYECLGEVVVPDSDTRARDKGHVLLRSVLLEPQTLHRAYFERLQVFIQGARHPCGKVYIPSLEPRRFMPYHTCAVGGVGVGVGGGWCWCWCWCWFWCWCCSYCFMLCSLCANVHDCRTLAERSLHLLSRVKLDPATFTLRLSWKGEKGQGSW